MRWCDSPVRTTAGVYASECWYADVVSEGATDSKNSAADVFDSFMQKVYLAAAAPIMWHSPLLDR